MKKFISAVFFAVMLAAFSLTAYAAYSFAWYQKDGNWYITGPNSGMVKSSWVCDNAAGPGCSDNWYLMDSNGVMITHPLVKDAWGNYYSMENRSGASYGMLRYTNGIYDGISLQFNQQRGGAFGAILNQDGINAMAAKYGICDISYIGKNCVYTGSYVKTVPESSTKFTVNYYVGSSKYKSKTSTSGSLSVIGYGSTLKYWEDSYTGEIYYPGETISYDGRSSVRLNGVFTSSQWAEDDYSTAKIYTIKYYLNGQCIATDTSDSNPMYVQDYYIDGFQRWKDSSGNPVYPGQYYSFSGSKTSVNLYAVVETSDYYYDDADDYNYYDDEWY